MDMSKFSLTKHDPQLVDLMSDTDHKTLAIWAINCLERFMPLLEGKYPNEDSPRTAINVLKKWINDEIIMWEARKFCWPVLAFAREIEKNDKASCLIARACSHTLATCHVPSHSEGSAMYTVAAVRELNKEKENCIQLMEQERAWQINKLIELKQK